MKYIDIHCHLDSEDFDADRSDVLARMKENEVGAITVGADLNESKKALEIAEANESVWACVGVHPNHVGLFEVKEFEKLIGHPKVVGVGECGLDYFRLGEAEKEIKEIQKNLFESHIQFAIKHDKPLMLHSREAFGDALDILQNYKKEVGERLRGNIHFFTGDIETAQKILDLGFTISFTGVITFTRDYDEVVRYIPQNSIMSETDAPWVAPLPFRGKRNEPQNVIEVIKKISEIRAENMDILNRAIINNAQRIFAI